MLGLGKFTCEVGFPPALNGVDQMPIDIVDHYEETRMDARETDEKPRLARLNQLSDSLQKDRIGPANRVEDMQRNISMPKVPKAPKLRYQSRKRSASPPYLCMVEGADESKRRKTLSGT
jgi:hypothetical protein